MNKYIVFAGVNGAGKTTFYQTNKEVQNMPRVNVDEIVRKFGRWDNPSDVIRAGREAVALINAYFSEGISFNQETTLCGKSILNNIEKAYRLGYSIDLYFVGLESVELAIKRVEMRVAAGGHGIPEKDIRRRFAESQRNLLKVMPLCSRVVVYDNTNVFRQIAVFSYGKCIDIDDNHPAWFDRLFESELSK
ncbi:MAG: zeta toxin family protein [Lachnospiraceae bacterium]|nr:zeta toxin family protein [Lachnospiraceae bacterium]